MVKTRLVPGLRGRRTVGAGRRWLPRRDLAVAGAALHPRSPGALAPSPRRNGRPFVSRHDRNGRNGDSGQRRPGSGAARAAGRPGGCRLPGPHGSNGPLPTAPGARIRARGRKARRPRLPSPPNRARERHDAFRAPPPRPGPRAKTSPRGDFPAGPRKVVGRTPLPQRKGPYRRGAGRPNGNVSRICPVHTRAAQPPPSTPLDAVAPKRKRARGGITEVREGPLARAGANAPYATSPRQPAARRRPASTPGSGPCLSETPGPRRP